MFLQEDVPLAPLTTLGVGGPARYYCEARSEDDVRDAVQFARSQGQRLFVLGGGSNVVFPDAGFDGLVLKIAVEGTHRDPACTFTVGAGVDWDDFVARAVGLNCAGVECLSGIPGTVGGTPVQNVGAYGQDVSQTISRIRAYDIAKDETVLMENAACRFGYRSSTFNTQDRDRYIILEVSFLLGAGGAPNLSYPDLQRYFVNRSTSPRLEEVRKAVLEIRRSKSMVLDAADGNSRSAGSFFKNPILSTSEFDRLSVAANARGLKLPSFPVDRLHRKVPAGWLVEQAGFPKGYRKGNAGISTNHALAIINRGGATAKEIIDLQKEIEAKVRADFGVELQSEPTVVHP